MIIQPSSDDPHYEKQFRLRRFLHLVDQNHTREAIFFFDTEIPNSSTVKKTKTGRTENETTHSQFCFASCTHWCVVFRAYRFKTHFSEFAICENQIQSFSSGAVSVKKFTMPIILQPYVTIRSGLV